MDAFVSALREHCDLDIHVMSYREHSVSSGEDAAAVAYVQMRVGDSNVYGVGLHRNIVTAALLAVLSATNRMVQKDLLAAPTARSEARRMASV